MWIGEWCVLVVVYMSRIRANFHPYVKPYEYIDMDSRKCLIYCSFCVYVDEEVVSSNIYTQGTLPVISDT